MSRIARDLASSAHTPMKTSELNLHRRGPTMQPLKTSSPPRIAVVGAGMAGLRCTDVLNKSGAHITVFEARDRVGGRVHQVRNGGYLVDTGSNWIHGTEGNPIMKLATQTNTAVMEPEERSVVFDKKGKQRSEKDSGTLSEEFWGMIMRAFQHSDRHSADIDVWDDLHSWLKEKWTQKFSGKDSYIDDLVEESRTWGQFVGSPVGRQSLKFFFLEEGLEGDNVFVASTYARILEEVAKPALASAEVLLNTPINHIRYRDSTDGSPVQITTSGGETHSFDEVVVTCPLGWLKRHHTSTFTPALPGRLVQAIDSIGYGALEKLYIAFPTAFWLTHGATSSYPCFTHFHHPEYHPNPACTTSEPKTWNQSVVALSHLPDQCEQPTLLFYMHGDCGKYITNHLAKNKLVPDSEAYNEFLRAFAQPFYQGLPNYDASTCQPVAFHMTTWQTDPYAGYGSYTTFRTGLKEGDKDIEIMRNAGGLSDRGKGLWIAGEHTAPFVALGTTTGAYWSGEGVARRIAELYGLVIPEDLLKPERDDSQQQNVESHNENGTTLRQTRSKP